MTIAGQRIDFPPLFDASLPPCLTYRPLVLLCVVSRIDSLAVSLADSLPSSLSFSLSCVIKLWLTMLLSTSIALLNWRQTTALLICIVVPLLIQAFYDLSCKGLIVPYLLGEPFAVLASRDRQPTFDCLLQRLSDGDSILLLFRVVSTSQVFYGLISYECLMEDCLEIGTICNWMATLRVYTLRFQGAVISFWSVLQPIDSPSLFLSLKSCSEGV